ncbi:MAG: AmmeMemoRadiSam system radical SAM enzyme, partial [Nitrosomonadaceae bacterium]|nr:AmmeMemoRadiSam system radical SAM enzyme [Nitrosomonadaceae bacterium]
IVRDWYEIKQYHVTAEGRCESCNATIAGRFAAFSGQFGRQRIPVRIGAPA